ncbi:hypothetical protein L596_006324 [Steinernema carpocapsae]|uniref:Uncharacterized protein n=1 Tax=Steinernema carpocapsae TaxID=34508 RepID=A0A4U8V1T8_STECR|nr:hypothetical protein L596_006324 [Steinernema carpocapsae]
MTASSVKLNSCHNQKTLFPFRETKTWLSITTKVQGHFRNTRPPLLHPQDLRGVRLLRQNSYSLLDPKQTAIKPQRAVAVMHADIMHESVHLERVSRELLRKSWESCAWRWKKKYCCRTSAPIFWKHRIN